ncbi:MAG: hypothetical protein ACLVIY_14320 [Anaerobutyricum soehngenii]
MGRVSSIHANSCRDALRRLETMVLMGMDMPLAAIQGLDCFFSRHPHTFGETVLNGEKDIRDKRD